MIFCTECGARLIAGDNFCTACGTRIVLTDSAQTQTKPTHKNSRRGRKQTKHKHPPFYTKEWFTEIVWFILFCAAVALAIFITLANNP